MHISSVQCPELLNEMWFISRRSNSNQKVNPEGLILRLCTLRREINQHFSCGKCLNLLFRKSLTTFFNADPQNTDDNCDMQVKQHYGEEGGQVEDSGVKGFMDLNTFLMKVNNYEVNIM